MNPGITFSKRGEEAELLRFLDNAFGFDPETNGFLTFLPKLYRKESDPCAHNLVLRENGKLTAAVGMYPIPLRVLGEPLSCLGIGNVAVDPAARGGGRMGTLLREALSRAEREGFDFAILGGQRQRYARFGFHPAGDERMFRFTAANLKSLPPRESVPVTVRSLQPESDALEPVVALHNAQPFHAVRSPERFYDILTSWNHTPGALWRGDRFAGYFLRKKDEIRELILRDPDDFTDAIRALLGEEKNLSVILNAYDGELILRAASFAESETLTQFEKFRVFRWIPVLSAALRLQASVRPLDDGVLTVRIGEDQPITLSTKGGVPSVRPATPGEPPHVALDEADAMSFFFGRESRIRERLPSVTRWWFPLVLGLRMADHI